SSDVSLAVLPVPPPGNMLDCGPLLRVVSMPPSQIGLALGAALGLALLCWKSAPFWQWLANHETAGLFLLPAVWWLWLAPGWLGPALAVWTCLRSAGRHYAAASKSVDLADRPSAV